MKRLPTSMELIQHLVQEPSVSSDDSQLDMSNRKLCEQLANWLDDLKFTCKLQPVCEHKDKWNLIATRGKGQGGIMLSGHTDTVPADEQAWQSDPWKLTASSQHLTGLGVTDMKAFFAVALSVINDLPAKHKPITLIATADEETTMAGARALQSQELPKPTLNLIGEPTSLVPVVSHKGYQAYRLSLTSQGGHSSLNKHQYNCLDAMHSVMGKLMQLRNALAHQTQNTQFKVPVSTLNLGTLKAGDAVNRICAEATLEFDIRPLPDLSGAALEALVQETIISALAPFEVSRQLAPLYHPIDGFLTSCQHHHLEHLCDVSGTTAITADYVTEASLFEQMGIPSIVLGPGSIDQAHRPNEQLPIAAIGEAENIYQQIISHYCF
ncbi:acetylornithine deacetylase [Pleionea sp. CnH1-48]|uniref:acetylornithine deacetylase n=1 Tax=Pleionea sp. CnH1-48 TaxID=2954494 RepID=UPI0020969ACE|nr:acetylornithine deacetylase [Pleionea sp. CnH1-48]MCO7224455.1 acetylornithine deacetylase [Pleionea sp. CnH1-48]